MHNYGCIGEVGDCIIITKAPTETVGAQRVEKVFFDTLTDVEKHTQTRKPLRQAYKGTLRSG